MKTIVVIQRKSQISSPGVLFSSAHAHVSFFLLCFSSAKQRSSLPHVNSWLHIHSPREDCRERLPLTSEGPTLLWVGQSCYGFIHSSSQHEDNTWSKQQVQICPCHNASSFFSKPPSFLPACLSRLMKDRCFKVMTVLGKKVKQLHLWLMFCLRSNQQWRLYCCSLADKWHGNLINVDVTFRLVAAASCVFYKNGILFTSTQNQVCGKTL